MQHVMARCNVLVITDKLDLLFVNQFHDSLPLNDHSFFCSSLGLVHEDSDNGSSNSDLPAIVVYMIDPFLPSEVSESKSPMWSLNGLIRAFAEMTSGFSDNLKRNVFLQVIVFVLFSCEKMRNPISFSLKFFSCFGHWKFEIKKRIDPFGFSFQSWKSECVFLLKNAACGLKTKCVRLL